MTMLANVISSGDSVISGTKLMLSLVSFWFVIMAASQLVNSSPMTDRLIRRTTREDHQRNPENPESNRIASDLFLNRKSFKLFNGVKYPDETKDLKFTHSAPSDSNSFDPSTPAYFGPKLLYKEFIYNKRRKRELRTSSRSSSSSTSNVPSKSSYHPFLMAEMIPGSVKTRHPSIIAVNGCPAYYIADHKGQCRQVFQYTVNFGQRLPNYHNPTSPPKHTIHLKNFFLHKEQQNQQNQQFSTTTLSPEIPNTPGKPIPIVQTPQSPPPSPSPRLLMLLRNAAKRFDLSFLKNQSSSSSNSGENTNEDKIDKLRRKILSALKITKNKDFSKDDSKNHPKERHNSNPNPSSTTSKTTSTTTTTTSTSTTTTTTTPDYDD